MRRFFLVSLAIVAVPVIMSLAWFLVRHGAPSLAARIKNYMPAAVFFVESITPEQLLNHYATIAIGPKVNSASPAYATTKPIRILIVPGHEPDMGGTNFEGKVYERNVVVDIADALAKDLSADPHFSVMVARDRSAWNPTLQSYFDNNVAAIESFREKQASEMQHYETTGQISTPTNQVDHNTAPTTTIEHLYGINKWTAENHYDITIHLHLNDYPGRRHTGPGKYDGFAIYVPDHQYSNYRASADIGKAIANRLNVYHATSTLPDESTGVVPDQQLIAIGSNNSANDAAILIEYAYIYEPQIVDPSTRAAAVTEYARDTYLGLEDFFNKPHTSGSAAVPWTPDPSITASAGDQGASIYNLQLDLRSLGFYPPSKKGFADCPISGYAGSCTRHAIDAFQAAHGLSQVGHLGPKTQAALANSF